MSALTSALATPSPPTQLGGRVRVGGRFGSPHIKGIPHPSPLPRQCRGRAGKSAEIHA